MLEQLAYAVRQARNGVSVMVSAQTFILSAELMDGEKDPKGAAGW